MALTDASVPQAYSRRAVVVGWIAQVFGTQSAKRTIGVRPSAPLPESPFDLRPATVGPRRSLALPAAADRCAEFLGGSA